MYWIEIKEDNHQSGRKWNRACKMQNHEEESHKDTKMRHQEQRKEKVVESENNQLREKMQKSTQVSTQASAEQDDLCEGVCW
jgi:hypothetical protein